MAVVVAAVLGLAALVGVAVVSRPALFLGAGLAVFLAATAVGVGLVTRKLAPGRRRRTRPVAVTVGALAGMLTFGVTALHGPP